MSHFRKALAFFVVTLFFRPSSTLNLPRSNGGFTTTTKDQQRENNAHQAYYNNGLSRLPLQVLTTDSTTCNPPVKKSRIKANRYEISPYYKRDLRDKSPLLYTQEQLQYLTHLLAKRHQAIKERKMLHSKNINDNEKARDTITSIDSVLKKQFNVTVYEQPPIWTRLSEPSLAQRRRQAQQRAKYMCSKYGPLGHPYCRVGSTDPNELLEYEINMILLNATMHKEGLYSELKVNSEEDILKLFRKLKSSGVHVNHTTMQWSTELGYDSSRHCNSMSNKAKHEQLNYTSSIHNLLPPIDARRICNIVNNRQNAILRGNNLIAAYITWELYHGYQVVISDVDQTVHLANVTTNCCYDNYVEWMRRQIDSCRNAYDVTCRQRLHRAASLNEYFLDCLFRDYDLLLPSDCLDQSLVTSSSSSSYRLCGLSQPLDPLFSDRIRMLVRQRMFKREEGRFLEADEIRNVLWQVYSVGVNDRYRQYSVGGVFCLTK